MSSLSIYQLTTASLLPRSETELLLTFLLNKNRAYLLTHPEEKLSTNIIKRFYTLQKKRLNNRPLAYLINQQGFYNLNLKVSPKVLIPRPETELMIDTTLNYLVQNWKKRIKLPLIIDVGTGSGAIIIATAYNLRKKYPRIYRHSLFYGYDISTEALKIARYNTALYRLQQKIIFKRSDLLQKLKSRETINRDLIINANLPYLTKKQIRDEKSIALEPKLALDGGPSGLSYYKRLFKELKNLPYLSLFLNCEIDPNQANYLQKFAKKFWPQAEIKIILDYRRKKRFLQVTNNN